MLEHIFYLYQPIRFGGFADILDGMYIEHYKMYVNLVFYSIKMIDLFTFVISFFLMKM